MQTHTVNVGGKELDDAIFQVMRRAAVDPEFRNLALKDGNAALAKINSNIAAVQTLDIHFLDRANPNPTRITMNLVLPDLVEAGELSELELEQVAGGLESASKQVHGVDIQTAN